MQLLNLISPSDFSQFPPLPSPAESVMEHKNVQHSIDTSGDMEVYKSHYMQQQDFWSEIAR